MLLRRLWLASTPILHLTRPTRAFDIFADTTSGLQQPFRLASNMTKGAVISLAHGGGPMPLLGDPGHKDIIASLQTRVPQILRLNTAQAPRAIILVTAHWSERVPTISNAKKHKLYYDYGGFPPEAYKLKYDAPGSPEVAQEIFDVLTEAGLKPENDSERGMIPSLLSAYPTNS